MLNKRLGGQVRGVIEVATFKMAGIVFWVDTSYHTAEGVVMALILSYFYKRFGLVRAD